MKQAYEAKIEELTKKLSALEEPIFNKSQCSSDPKENLFFNEIMENKKFRTALRYRASRDGWMA
jgi:phosphoribosylaminoimidazole-succinocarboxamide synthase